MNKISSAIICLVSLAGGIIFFGIQNDYLILRKPTALLSQFSSNQPHKKNIRFYYWSHNRWHYEADQLFWSNYHIENLQRIINQWFKLIEEQELIHTPIIATLSMAPNDQLLFCSFNRNPFSKKWSLHQKWMLIEGLLKTIAEVDPTIKEIQFLLRHQSLIDSHLDFSHAWPLHGFTRGILQ
jgi:hypothetical protein